MCNCDIGTLPNGNNGADGIYGGYSSDWLFNATTTSGPATSTLRFNSATYNTVNTIWINDTNNDAIDIGAILDTFTAGYIRIFKKDDNTKFWYGLITANTDSGTYHTLTVTYILHNGAFAATDNIVVTYTPTGATGAAGSNGTNGINYPVVLYNDQTISGISSSTAEQTLKSYTLPAGTLTTNGDICEITAIYRIVLNLAQIKRPTIYFGAKELVTNDATTNVYFYDPGVGVNSRYIVIKAEVSRNSATSQTAITTSSKSIVEDGSIIMLTELSTPAETLANPIVISVKGQNTSGSANSIQCYQLLVKYLKK